MTNKKFSVQALACAQGEGGGGASRVSRISTVGGSDAVSPLMAESRRGGVERGFAMTLGRVFDREDRGLLQVLLCLEPFPLDERYPAQRQHCPRLRAAMDLAGELSGLPERAGGGLFRTAKTRGVSVAVGGTRRRRGQ